MVFFIWDRTEFSFTCRDGTGRGAAITGPLKDAGINCSGSTTVGVGLANGGRFGLMLCDNGLGGRLMLNDNGLTLTDNGSPTAQPAHAY
jgi:hypothetical protein